MGGQGLDAAHGHQIVAAEHRLGQLSLQHHFLSQGVSALQAEIPLEEQLFIRRHSIFFQSVLVPLKPLSARLGVPGAADNGDPRVSLLD